MWLGEVLYFIWLDVFMMCVVLTISVLSILFKKYFYFTHSLCVNFILGKQQTVILMAGEFSYSNVIKC